MKLLTLAIFAAFAAVVNAAAIDHPFVEKRCTDDYKECGSASECCSGNCGKLPVSNTEYKCCKPA